MHVARFGVLSAERVDGALRIKQVLGGDLQGIG